MSKTDWAIGLFILGALIFLAVVAIRPSVTIFVSLLALLQAASIVREWRLQR